MSRPSLKKTDFFYQLPAELIAQVPVKRRDQSRLLIYDRKSLQLSHEKFQGLLDYLKPGDLLVLNNTKVMPARLFGKKAETGGRVEVFLLRALTGQVWEVLLRGSVAPGLQIIISPKLKANTLKDNRDGTWLVEFNLPKSQVLIESERIGSVPLPPYIRQGLANAGDARRYQTVYAKAAKSGSVAAPTAGLHFTPALLKQIQKKGVKIGEVTLQVGLGTFAPVKTVKIRDHKMHAEKFEVPLKTCKLIALTKKRGGRVFAVGTTAARTLESVGEALFLPQQKLIKGETSIFIYPPYKFKIVDGLITNFHLPESTLLMMLAAFLEQFGGNGLSVEKKLYQEAIKERYRFFSYGDAMLVI